MPERSELQEPEPRPKRRGFRPFRAIDRFLLGEREHFALPQRVTEALQTQQRQSEMVISLFQVVIVGFFSMLYIISPSSAPPGAFEPVPFAMGGWFIFAILRFLYVCLHDWRDGVLILGVWLDMFFLIGLIFSFHLQYQQPPVFSLKAPAIVYAFIFIALRALRFDARLVIMAGFAASIGWGALIWYAVVVGGENDNMMQMAEGYVDYINNVDPNAILYGAELEKILAFVVVTLILAASLVRAKRVLTRAVMEQFAAADLSRFFDADVAARIRESGQALKAGEGEFRDCAIMFIDLRGFTPLSERLEPKELITLLSEYQSLVVPVIRKHHGAIDKFMGDGIMATFGAVVPIENYAADVMRAADELIAAAAKWRVERETKDMPSPRIGCAMAAGRVTAGVIGHQDRLEFTVIGDAVNLAAKLEKQTKKEECTALTTRALLELALAQGYKPTSPKIIRTKRTVQGAPQPVDLCVVA